MIKNIKKRRVNSFEELRLISRIIVIDEIRTAIIPEGVYCMSDTKVVLNADEEYQRDWQRAVDREREDMGKILLPGY